MAESTNMSRLLENSLECSVCLLTYNNKNQKPMALRCMHALCKSCVETLSRKSAMSVVKCPECRENTDRPDVKPNYPLINVLDAFHKCKREEQQFQRYLSKSSNDSRLRSFESEMESKFEGIVQEIGSRSKTVKAGKVQADHILENINRIREVYRVLTAKCQEKLDNKITELHKRNIDCLSWKKETIDTKIIKPELRPVYYKVVEKEQTKSVFDKCMELVNVSMCIIVIVLTLVRFKGNITYDYTHVHATLIAISSESGARLDKIDVPCGIAVSDDGYIFVADRANHRLKIYDERLNFLSNFGKKGTGKNRFNFPSSVAVSPNGQVYVSDYANNRIQVLKMTGNFLKHFTILNITGLNNPQGLAFDNNNNLYICDQENYRVLVVRQDGSYVRSIGDNGTGPGQLQAQPVFVTVTKEQRVLVSQSKTNVILVFDVFGTYIDTYPNSAPSSLTDLEPRGMATDKLGNIIIADNKGRLVVLDKNGIFVSTIGSKGDHPGQFNKPHSVAVDRNGDIIVNDYGNDRIQVFEVGQTTWVGFSFFSFTPRNILAKIYSPIHMITFILLFLSLGVDGLAYVPLPSVFYQNLPHLFFILSYVPLVFNMWICMVLGLYLKGDI